MVTFPPPPSLVWAHGLHLHLLGNAAAAPFPSPAPQPSWPRRSLLQSRRRPHSGTAGARRRAGRCRAGAQVPRPPPGLQLLTRPALRSGRLQPEAWLRWALPLDALSPRVTLIRGSGATGLLKPTLVHPRVSPTVGGSLTFFHLEDARFLLRILPSFPLDNRLSVCPCPLAAWTFTQGLADAGHQREEVGKLLCDSHF